MAGKIFISYTRIDLEPVRRIYNQLKTAGHQPWLDVEDILPGEDWQIAINKAIKESDFFIAILSQNSVSRRGVIQKEIRRALAKMEELLPGDLFIIPIRLDDCEIPERLTHLNVLDWEDGEGFTKLLSAISTGEKQQDADIKDEIAKKSKPFKNSQLSRLNNSDTAIFGRSAPTSIVVALIITGGIIVAAIIIYYSAIQPTLIEIRSTQTAEARLTAHMNTETAQAFILLGSSTTTMRPPAIKTSTPTNTAALPSETKTQPITETFALPMTPTPAVGGGPGQIAFSAPDQDGDLNIYSYILTKDDDNLEQLTDLARDNYDPSWSPDGNTIVFVSNRDGIANVYVMAADGSDVHNVTHSRNEESGPVWSPDGEKIVFAAHTGNTQIYKINPDGSDYEQLSTNPGYDGHPTVLTGTLQTVVYQSFREDEGNSTLYRMYLDGSDDRRLSNLRLTINQDTSPSASADGSKILFVSEFDGQQDLFVINADGTNSQRLTDTESNEYSPSWSPDGNYLVFVSDRGGSECVYYMPIYGDQEDWEEVNCMVGINHPSWRP